MTISKKLLKYFNRKASKSSDKNHTRYRNDICNHWDLDYLSMEELEERFILFSYLRHPIHISNIAIEMNRDYYLGFAR
jgi:hypothetical protein